MDDPTLRNGACQSAVGLSQSAADKIEGCIKDSRISFVAF
jgi:hypothetical protein